MAEKSSEKGPKKRSPAKEADTVPTETNTAKPESSLGVAGTAEAQPSAQTVNNSQVQASHTNRKENIMSNTTQALGMIETKGLVGSIEAADAMVKGAWRQCSKDANGAMEA